MLLRQGSLRSPQHGRREALHRSLEPSAPQSAGESSLSRGDMALGIAVFVGILVAFLLKAPDAGFYATSSDHGFQLSIGTQVLLGRVPGVDVVIGYGPLVMYTSALGLWLTNHSLIGETLICAGGHALAIFLIYHLVSRYASKLVGLLAAGFAYFLQIRLYKWYVWLIPLAILWAWHRYVRADREQRRPWIVATGLILGMCSLFRPDYGITETAVVLVLLGFFEVWALGQPKAQALQSMGILVASVAVLPLAWLVYLAAGVSLEAPAIYLKTTAMAMLGVSQGLAHPPPPIRSVLLAHGLIPATYLLVVCAACCRLKSVAGDTRSWFLLASALVGLACEHQSWHRMDPGHLLQVLSPVIVCAALVTTCLIGGLDGAFKNGRLAFWLRCAGVGYALTLALLGLKLARWGQLDLDSFSCWPVHRYRRLASPLSDPAAVPQAPALSYVRRETDASDSILVFPLDCQFYALTNRRISGRLHAYYPGVFTSQECQADNLAAIEADMPKLVVVGSEFEGSKSPLNDELIRDCRSSHANIEQFIRQNYPRVVLKSGGVIVLSR